MKIKKSTPQSQKVETGESSLSRRAALCGIAAIVIGVNPERAIAANGISMNSAGQVEVTLSANPALKKVGGVVQFTDGAGQAVALVRTGKSANAFRALNLSCTHEGTNVQKSGSKWVCPNHRAEFALNGDVKVGPARANLVQIPVKVSTTKVVVG